MPHLFNPHFLFALHDILIDLHAMPLLIQISTFLYTHTHRYLSLTWRDFCTVVFRQRKQSLVIWDFAKQLLVNIPLLFCGYYCSHRGKFQRRLVFSWLMDFKWMFYYCGHSFCIVWFLFILWTRFSNFSPGGIEFSTVWSSPIVKQIHR